MTKKQNKIIKFYRKNPGVHSYKELAEAGAYVKLIQDMLEEGILEEVTRGFYRLSEQEHEQYSDLENISAVIPEAVFCLISALDFHGIGTQRAFDFHIALPRGKRKPEREDFSIQHYYFSDDSYKSGIEDHGSFKVYCPAKTVADCFKFRNKIGLDVALEAMKETIRSKKATRAEIIAQAEVCRVRKVIFPYLEAFS